MRDRGRLVLTDLVYILVALLGLGAFWPVLAGLIGGGALSGRMELLFSSMLPLAVLILLAIVMVEAREGL